MSWRFPFILLGCSFVLATLSRLVIDPSLGNPSLTPVIFPAKISLSDGPTIQQIPKPEFIGPQAISARAEAYYHTQWQGQPVTLTLQYFFYKDKGPDNGDVNFYIHQFLPTTPIDQGKVYQDPTLGAYRLYSYRGQLYLSSCINVRGPATLTAEAFADNRRTYDEKFERILPWLFNQAYWWDQRCLWTQISTPIQKDASVAQVRLQQLWPKWATWWQANFPPL